MDQWRVIIQSRVVPGTWKDDYYGWDQGATVHVVLPRLKRERPLDTFRVVSVVLEAE